MEFLTQTKIDFMKHRKGIVWISVVLLIVAFAEFWLDGLNLGIDFEGGTQMQVRFDDEPQPDEVRQVLVEAGLREAVIQRFGAAEARELLIKNPVVEGSEEGSAAAIIKALDDALNADISGQFDLNQRGSDTLATLLGEADPDERLVAGDTDSEREAYYLDLADRVIAAREQLQIFSSWDDVRGVEGLSAAAASHLEGNAALGKFHILSTENVGPQIGGELTRKGQWAVALSLIGMLLYIWYRFELRFGIGALVAAFHDLAIVLGLYALMDYEFNLPTIAAFLTLVGYSVNDTVVIFDRVRENMRRFRRKSLVDVINISLNQTLARTILTSSTTLLAVGSLFLFGGEVLEGFAFVMLVGVVIGTYSSIFVASPFTLLWEQYFGRDARERRATPAKARAKAKTA